MVKRTDLLFALAWAATAALAGTRMRGELGRGAREEAAAFAPRSPFIEEGAPPAAPPAAQAAPAKGGHYAVGGHRSVDAERLLRLIQAGELSDREAAEYGGAP